MCLTFYFYNYGTGKRPRYKSVVEMILNCNLNIHAVTNYKDRERYDT